MKKLPSQETLTELLDYCPNTGSLHWRERSVKWFKKERDASGWNKKYAGQQCFLELNNGYLRGGLLGQTYFAHRIIYKIIHGEDPHLIDHINGNPRDNRIGNLRSVTTEDNCKNVKRRNTNTSGVTGVYFMKSRGKWKAEIGVRRKLVYLGLFNTKSEAIAARQKAQLDHGYHANHGR